MSGPVLLVRQAQYASPRGTSAARHNGRRREAKPRVSIVARNPEEAGGEARLAGAGRASDGVASCIRPRFADDGWL